MRGSLFRHYGLKYGEPVRITEHPYSDGTGKKKPVLFQNRKPDRIGVIAEYPFVIHLRGTWKGFHTYEYDFCVEKASIYCGEVELARLQTGERLKPKELLSDYEREKRRKR